MFSKFRRTLILIIILSAQNIFSQNVDSISDIDLILNKAIEQYLEMIEKNSDNSLYPRSTNEDGSLNLVEADDWTSGFFPGVLWYLYEYSHKNNLLEQASYWTEGLESEKSNTRTHDIGFMLNSSYGNGYRLIDDPGYEEIIIQAANSLSKRYNSTIGCIRSWDFGSWTFPVIIDNMMNLELLFKASEISHNPSYREKAISHANITMANNFRADYSSYHLVDYNMTTGSVIGKTTHQGYSNESTWARGQSWGLYGFTMCYRYTKDEKYLKLAENLARYIINHKNFPDDYVPYWDFNDPKIPNAPKDVSAASIMCSALFELSKYSKEYGKTFLEVAIKQINSLSSKNYTAETGANNNFILMHGTGNHPWGKEIDSPLIYGDYYYIEALTRYRRYLNHSPIVDFSFSQNETYNQIKIDFNASLSTDPDGDSMAYIWDFGDNKKGFSHSALISHVYDKPGIYSVILKVVDKWDGIDTLKQIVSVNALTSKINLESSRLSVYPNPASDSVTIELPFEYGPANVYVVNYIGQKQQIKLNPGKNLIQTINWKDSLHVICFETHSGSQQIKLLITKNG